MFNFIYKKTNKQIKRKKHTQKSKYNVCITSVLNDLKTLPSRG